MTHESSNEAWEYSQDAMNWYGWGSPVGFFDFALFIGSLGGFIFLLHAAEVIR